MGSEMCIRDRVNGIGEKEAWVRWATDELSSATLSYELIESDSRNTDETGSKSGVIENMTLARSHALHLKGLRSASLYSFEVFSTDASGNTSRVVVGDFKTAMGADLVPPTFARAPDIQAQVEDVKIAFLADEVVIAEVRYDSDDSPQDGRVALSSAPSQGHKNDMPPAAVPSVLLVEEQVGRVKFTQPRQTSQITDLNIMAVDC